MGSIILGIIFLLICYLGIGLYYSWPYLLIGAGVVALILIILYLTVGKRECKYCGRKYNTLSNKPCPSCDGMDFKNIETVDIINCEMTYRIETEEEFDPVMTNFLTEQDGWQHYETKTVEYEVENGYEYTFLIYYKNGSKETRVYHESSNFAQRLISISENSSLQKNIADSFTRLATTLEKLAEQESEEDETVVIEDIPLKDFSYMPIKDFVILNIETTGSNNNYLTADFDEIISVSIFDENGTVLLDELCDTEWKKTWDEAQKIHSISPENVKGLPTFSDILKDVLQILSEHHCVIAHDMVSALGFIKGYVKSNPDANELYHKISWRLDVDSDEIYEFYESHRDQS